MSAHIVLECTIQWQIGKTENLKKIPEFFFFWGGIFPKDSWAFLAILAEISQIFRGHNCQGQAQALRFTQALTQ